MTHNTDAEHAEFEAHAFSEGWAYQDPQHGVVFYDHLPKVIAWKSWQAARRAPVAPQKVDYLDGVHIPRLREALTFLGRGNGYGEGEVAAKLSEYVNSITRAVLACKELLRTGSPAEPVQLPSEAITSLWEAIGWHTAQAIDSGNAKPGEKLTAAVDRVIALLSAQEPMSDSQILEIQDKYVGIPCPEYPLDNSDWINFARAIERAHNIK